jgi:hypothetical protein
MPKLSVCEEQRREFRQSHKDWHLHFKNIDLIKEERAAAYVKHETVSVEFAAEPGELVSREGPNHYQRGDAIVTGSNGDVWSVSRDRFDARYESASPSDANTGRGGAYRNKPIPVLALQIRESFTLERSAGGDTLKGKPGDWLIQYAPEDYGIVDRDKFRRLYLPTNPH